MRIGLYGRPRNVALAAFAEGAEAAGHSAVFRGVEVFTSDQVESFDVVVVTGIRCAGGRAAIASYQRADVPVLVYDIGHVRRKQGYCRFSPEALMRLPQEPCLPDRFAELGFTPLAGRGDDILVCGEHPVEVAHQTPASAFVGWVEDAIRELRRATSRRIVFRPHPVQTITRSLPGDAVQHPKEIPFQAALERAWAVVGLYGGCATEAILLGIPAYTAPDAMQGPWASGFTEYDLGEIESPRLLSEEERVDFGSRLAYTQWQPRELRKPETVSIILSMAVSDAGKVCA